MMTRTRWTWLLLLAALVMGVGSMAAAQCPMQAKAAADMPSAPQTPAPPAMMGAPGGCGAPMGCAKMGPMGLNDDQRKAIEKIRTDGQDAMLSARKEMMRLRHAMQGEMLKDDLDAGAIRKLVEKMGDLRTQMQLQRLEQRLAIRKLLTPEQRDRAMLRQGHRGDRGPRGMHRMMGRGGCMSGPAGCPQGMQGCCPMGGQHMGFMGGPGCSAMGGPQGGPGCGGKGASQKGCMPGPGCGHMQAPPQGKDSSGLPEGSDFEGGFDRDPDLMAVFDLGFGPDFDLGFDEDLEGMDAPMPPEPLMESMTP